MERFSVVIAGGGVAALEGLLRLHKLAGEAVETTLLAPNEEFAFRALSVKEPFALGAARRHPIRRLVRAASAEWVQDTLGWVDPDGQLVHTGEGAELPYDALLLATGARTSPAYEHATTFRDGQADELLHGIVQDLEAGYTKRVVFVAPEGPMWMLPLYELALMSAERARSAGMDDVELVVVTREQRPLAGFGVAGADALGDLLDEAGVTVYAGSTARIPAGGRVLVQPRDIELRAERVIALPRISGPALRGVPAGQDGFLAVDDHCLVPGTGGRVFAAGDVVSGPVKHGGLSAQQADVASAAIARLAGADVEAPALHPVIHGMLLTGGRPLYLRARLVGGTGFETEVSGEPLWPSGAKVVAEELGDLLADGG
jgi:sulfide:quinone oxidoreductase